MSEDMMIALRRTVRAHFWGKEIPSNLNDWADDDIDELVSVILLRLSNMAREA